MMEGRTMKIRRFFGILLVLTLLMTMFSVPALAASGYAVKATASVNLRKGPGLDYAKITSISKGRTLTYLNISQLDARGIAWHKVSYNGSSAWISWRYSNLTKDGKAVSEAQAVEATASVNLRKGPGTSYAVITSVSKGARLVYLGERTKVNGVYWYKVSSAHGIAWLTSQYSKLVDPTKGMTSVVETTGSVHLRKGPGLDYAAITSVSSGRTFAYISSSTDSRGVNWYKVSYDGGIAWISSKYSKKV
jgi:uncharacterized protein YraI